MVVREQTLEVRGQAMSLKWAKTVPGQEVGKYKGRRVLEVFKEWLRS